MVMTLLLQGDGGCRNTQAMRWMSTPWFLVLMFQQIYFWMMITDFDMLKFFPFFYFFIFAVWSFRLLVVEERWIWVSSRY